MLRALALPAKAGLMDPEIGEEVYRDFAENRGAFQPGAQDVPIFNKNGDLVGEIPIVPDFDSVHDKGWATLVANPSFVATVAHNRTRKNLSFARRFGADAAPFDDSYDMVAYNRLDDDPAINPGGDYDHAIPRLNKIVTEAEPTPFFFKDNYDGPEDSYLEIGKNLFTVRMGGGTQAYATAPGEQQQLSGPYRYLTGGTTVFSSVGEALYPNTFNYRNWYKFADTESPLSIGSLGGG